MFCSKIKEILQEKIADNEELKPLEDHFHGIESEINGMANKFEADLNKIISRANELIYRVFDGHHAWLASKWKDIEDDIRKELKDLEK